MHRPIAFLAFFLLAALGAGCAADPAPLPVDPTGTWSMTFAWTTGDCQLTGSFTGSLTVLRSADGYQIDEPRPEVSVTGTVSCTAMRCELSFTEAGPGPSGSTVQHIIMAANLAVDELDAITGGGSVTYRFTGGTGCQHQFTAQGTRR